MAQFSIDFSAARREAAMVRFAELFGRNASTAEACLDVGECKPIVTQSIADDPSRHGRQAPT
ncbi:hypothetical protein SEUCBS139899_003851 [Sporothrix eucalyptigena]